VVGQFFTTYKVDSPTKIKTSKIGDTIFCGIVKEEKMLNSFTGESYSDKLNRKINI
jgi:hypothetical protein